MINFNLKKMNIGEINFNLEYNNKFNKYLTSKDKEEIKYFFMLYQYLGIFSSIASLFVLLYFFI